MGNFIRSSILILTAFCLSQTAMAQGYLEFTGKARCDDKAVANAKVTLYMAQKKITAVRTDATGKFFFEIAYDQKYRIVLNKEGYTQMVVEVNGMVPASAKGWIMSYSTTFDIFKHREGFKTKLSREALIKVAYMTKKQNFGSLKPYQNTPTYIVIREDEKPVFKDNGIEATDKDPREGIKTDKPVTKTPVEPDEVEYVKEQGEKEKQASFKEDVVESVAAEDHPGEVTTKRRAESLDEKRNQQMKISSAKESLSREQEKARAEVVKNEAQRSTSQKRLMMEIADMIKEEKKNENKSPK